MTRFIRCPKFFALGEPLAREALRRDGFDPSLIAGRDRSRRLTDPIDDDSRRIR